MSSYSGRFISNQKVSPNPNKTDGPQEFTLKQLSNHNRDYSCLVGVNGKVYNISKLKKDLDKQTGTNNRLDIKCGSNYNNVNVKNILKMDAIDYRDYEIGNIKYYNLMLILKFLFKLLIVVAFIALYKYTNNIFVLLPLIIYLLIIIYSFYFNFWEKQKKINNRLEEINPNLVKTKKSSRVTDKIYNELNRDINNMLYGVDDTDDL